MLSLTIPGEREAVRQQDPQNTHMLLVSILIGTNLWKEETHTLQLCSSSPMHTPFRKVRTSICTRRQAQGLSPHF